MSKTSSISITQPSKAPLTVEESFLPDLCSVQAVFHLVLVGELLALALAIAKMGVAHFSWYQLGVLSMLTQWIVLSSAACLCPLRSWFDKQKPMVAGCVSYTLVMVIATTYGILGSLVSTGDFVLNWDSALTTMLIAALFSGIVLRYFYLQQQVRNQQQAELKARIQALQSRIRPHFLFNSMNSIASLIDFDPKTAEQMVVDLSDLFRASLNEPGLIPLSREMELCQRFANIEKVRIGDRLNLQWQLEYPEHAQVPSLLLQPLVENAIYHGVQPLTEGGTVSTQVQCDATTCTVTVSNPLGDQSQATSKGNGIALANIRHRLDAYYHQQGQLDVNQDATTYTVKVRFPLASNAPDPHE